jgi:hypothetical protein
MAFEVPPICNEAKWRLVTRLLGLGPLLLTLAGTVSLLVAAGWSADGKVILAGAWQAWRAPSWEEIAAAEAKQKTETKQP